MNSVFFVNDPRPLSAGGARRDLTTPHGRENNRERTPDSSVTQFVMYLCMAGLAEAHQITFCMGSALRDGDNMMHLFNRLEPSFFEALFAQRMRRRIAVTNALPCPPVFLVHIGSAAELVVAIPRQLLMLGTILTVRKVRAAGERAWSLRSCRHDCTSVVDIKKAPADVFCEGRPMYFFRL